MSTEKVKERQMVKGLALTDVFEVYGASARRKPQPVQVPCDWCRAAIGDDCAKCGGTGVIDIPQRKTA